MTGRDFALAATAAAVVALGPAATALGGAGAQPGRPSLVIAAPWVDAEAAVEAAGGRVIGPLRAPLAALGVMDDAAALDRLSRMVWLIVDGGAAARLCGVEFGT